MESLADPCEMPHMHLEQLSRETCGESSSAAGGKNDTSERGRLDPTRTAAPPTC